MGTVATEERVDELCDEVFALEGVVNIQRDEIAKLNGEATKAAIELQDARKELQVTRDVVAIRDSRIGDLEAVITAQENMIAMLVEDLGIHKIEVVRLNKDLARKHETIAGQLTRIEQLDNVIQNRLVDISALEDTISDRDTVRRSVKFNAVHMLQSALAVLNGL